MPDKAMLKTPNISVNVTNLANKKGDYQVLVGAAAGAYNTYSIPPRMVFATLSANF
jgi:iron complex outermembrane receptor protein